MAGMYWPNVPFGGRVGVREAANVARLARPASAGLEVEVAVCVSGRISSVPMALSPPVPNQLLRMSSRATVRPGSTENVVCLPELMPVFPLGVKVSWYLRSCGEVFDTRTSDWNWELM